MNIKLENGHSAEVSHSVRTDKSVLLTANADGHEYEHTLTLGAVDQSLPDNYTAEQLDNDMAAARKHAASMAVSLKRKHALLQKI